MKLRASLQKRIDQFMLQLRNGNIYFNQKELAEILAQTKYWEKLAGEKEMLVCALGREKTQYVKEAEGSWRAVEQIKAESLAIQHNLELANETISQLQRDKDFDKDRIATLVKQNQSLLSREQTTVDYQFRSVNATGTTWGIWKSVTAESFASIKELNKKQGGNAHQFRELVEKTYVR